MRIATAVVLLAFAANVGAAEKAQGKQELDPDVLYAKAEFLFYATACRDHFDDCDTARAFRRGGESLAKSIRPMWQGREDAETKFVALCGTCASPDVCEADRINIRDGKGSLTYNPCRCSDDPKVAKTEGCRRTPAEAKPQKATVKSDP